MDNNSFDPNAYGNQQGANNQNNGAQQNPQNNQQNPQGAQNGRPYQEPFQQQPYNGQPYQQQPYQQQPYNGQPYQQPYNPYQPAVQPAHNLAMASLICSIISFFCCGLPLSIAGLICAIKAKNQGNTESIRTAGFVVSIIALVIYAISFIFSLLMMPILMETLEESFREVMFILHR